MTNADLRKAELMNNLLSSLDAAFEVEEEQRPDLGTWAVKNQILLDGRMFQFKKHEYLIEPYKDEHPFQVEIKAAQLGLTSKALLKVLYGSRYGKYKGILYLFPSKTDVTDLSKGRLDPLLDDNPETIGSWLKETDSANIKKVWNSYLYLRGMMSKIGLKCHDDKTEVLTRAGWKNFAEATMDDMFATLNSKYEIQYQKPVKIFCYPHQGKMEKFLVDDVELCVTGNHRLMLLYGGYRYWTDAGLANYLEIRPDLLLVNGTTRVLPISTKEDYNGYVYCASVPAGNLCTRIGNSTGVWSGNSVPVDMIVFDELDEAPQKAVDMAMERMGHSEIGEALFLSNPTMPDYGIDKLWQSTDMQYWLLKCPKCNHYTNMVETFPDCLKVVKNKTFRACEKCHSELNPSVGQWVAKRPHIKERRGRQFSQLFSQSKTTEPETMLQTYLTTNNITSYMNLKVGVAYVEAQNRLSVQEVLDCCGNRGMASESETGTFMGVDQGNFLHVVIGKQSEERAGEVIYLGIHKGNNSKNVMDETGWMELDALMNRFRVVRCVVDALPNTKFAKNFANRFKGRVFVNYYNEFQKGNIKWNERDLIVQGNRTETLDASHNLITTQSVILPRITDLTRLFATQMHNVAKRLEVDEETGSQRYAYLRLGDDHFRHAFNYFTMCLQNTPKFMFPELM